MASTSTATLATKPVAPSSEMDWDKLTFSFTRIDHMYVSHTKKGEPFPKGTIVPYGPLPLEPASTILNYGQGIFEGIKAFRTVKDRIVIFRPEENSKRMNSGAQRFLMPPVPQEVFLDGLSAVVRSNCKWIPPVDKGSLYFRPLLFGSGSGLGVGPSPEYTFCVYASPVGPYFKGGKTTPISLSVCTTTHRAAPKGCGDVKAVGNYAPCFHAQKTAKEEGFSEVLFLDAVEEKYVEEAGLLNLFAVLKDKTIVTPGLGTILEGVTRGSIVQFMRDKGFKVIDDRRLALQTVCEAAELFGAGTGASVSPVGSVTHEGKRYVFNDGQVGEVTKEISKALLDVQMERTPDRYHWLFDPFARV